LFLGARGEIAREKVIKSGFGVTIPKSPVLKNGKTMQNITAKFLHDSTAGNIARSNELLCLLLILNRF
jgi:hypothetical protein